MTVRMRQHLFILLPFIIVLNYSASLAYASCNARVFEGDSFVCVCNGTICDIIDDVTLPPPGTFKRVISSRDEHRFTVSSGSEDDMPTAGDIKIKVYYAKTYQVMLGFGGAFTDSTGIVINSLSETAQENLLRSYFSKNGIAYNLCRIPIAGTDFSTHPYSYDDEVDEDLNLEHFALTREDFEYKIPLIKRAQEISDGDIRIFASPWSPPAWMKENKKLNGKGGLLREMWTPYSNYLIKFVEEYKKNNISLWGLTTINEPLAGFDDWPWNVCAWSAEDMRDWIKTDFGPAIEKANMRYLKIMIYEHGRSQLSTYPFTILQDSEANNYVDGVGIHWYDDSKHKPEVMDELQSTFLDKFLLYTEACEGSDTDVKVILGSWERAERYASSIIESVNHYSAGWVDWNMALNMQGGPTWAKNFVDSPVIVNEEANEFYKQPMFYIIGHFSKFVPPGSKRLLVETDDSSDLIQTAAFDVPETNSIVIVVLNKDEQERKIVLQTPSKKFLNVKMNAKSIETIILNANVEKASRFDEL